MRALIKVIECTNRLDGLKLSQAQMKDIEKDLIRAGFASQVVAQSDIKYIKTAVKKFSHIKSRCNPLKVTASSQHICNGACPLCAITASERPMVGVKLYKNRPALFCPEHSVILPISVEQLHVF